jgi:hypothetical protein
MKLVIIVSAVAAMITFHGQPLSAQESERGACKADREKFCADLKPGDGKLGPCMRQHEAELSPQCVAARRSAEEARNNIRATCKAEADKLCADAVKERGGLVRCLESHASEVGQACADALKARPGAKNT